jgi:hypothetical protein
MTPTTERRKGALTSHDIELIQEVIAEVYRAHRCRYNIGPEEMSELMQFLKSFRVAYLDSTSMIRKWVLGLILSGAASLIGFGLYKRLQ